jgi:hypothetical protein
MAFPENRPNKEEKTNTENNNNENTVSQLFENAGTQEEILNQNEMRKQENSGGQKSFNLITKPKVENRKKYSFTIKPSAREKLNKLAKEHNYPSASRFIEELIESI